MKCIFTLLIASFALLATAQSTFVTQVQATATSNAGFKKIIQLGNGVSIAAGNCPSSTGTGNAILLSKLDGFGRVINSKAIEAPDQNLIVNAFIKTSDNGFAIAANVNGSINVMKFEADLTVEWEKQLTIGEDAELSAYTIYQKKDGSFLLGCQMSNFVQSSNSALLIGISASGDIISTKTFLSRSEGTFGFNITGVTETSDGNEALLASRGKDIGSTTQEDSTLLIKITSEGNILWSEVVKVDGQGALGFAILSTSDHSIVITGAADFLANFGSGPQSSSQCMMAKFDENGAQKWITYLASDLMFQSYFQSLVEDKSGNYVFGGTGLGFDASTTVLENYNYFARLSANGSLLWTRKAGTHAYPAPLQLASFAPTEDGGFIACGTERMLNLNNISVAALYKYDSTMGSCTGEAADSIGNLIESGSVTPVEIVSDSVTVLTTDIVSNVSDYGTFLYPCSSILPVTLLSFTANISNNLVNVNWKTANEINADYYTVERSSNGNAFSGVQKVSAKGSSTGTFFYTTADASPLPGTSYYRLLQTDRDGHKTYSSVVKVTRTSNGSVAIYPNPVQNIIHVMIQTEIAGKLMLQVTDITGKTVITQSHSATAGMNTIDIAAAGLGKGIYLVKIVQDNKVQTIRVVKQ